MGTSYVLFLTKQEDKSASMKEDGLAIEEWVGILSMITEKNKPCSNTGSWFNVVMKVY